MNRTRLDHLILLTDDLDRMSAMLADAGFIVRERADEKPGSTVSRFVVFPDGSYVQVAAFRSRESIATNRLGPVMAAGGGWADYAFAVEDLDTTAVHAANVGVTLGPVHEVGNTVADAGSWRLRLLLAGRGAAGDDALPFLVQDVSGRSVRVPPAAVHPNGALGIASITVASPTPAESAARCRALAGCMPGPPGEPGTDVLAGSCRIAFVPLAGPRAIAGPLSVTVRAETGSKPLRLVGLGRPGSGLVLAPGGLPSERGAG